MAAVITLCSVASSMAVAKVKLGSEVGLGDGVLILRNLSRGVSFRLGRDRKVVGLGEDEDCERVTRLSESDAAADAAAPGVAAVVAVAGSFAVAVAVAGSSSPHGHM